MTLDTQKMRELWTALNTYLIVHDCMVETSGPESYRLLQRLTDLGEQIEQQMREATDGR